MVCYGSVPLEQQQLLRTLLERRIDQVGRGLLALP